MLPLVGALHRRSQPQRDLRLHSIKNVMLTLPPPFIYKHHKPLGVIDDFPLLLIKRSWHCFIISSRLKINGLPVKTSVCKLVFTSLRGRIYMLGFKHARNEKLKFHLAHFLFKHARTALCERKKEKKNLNSNVSLHSSICNENKLDFTC